MTISGNFEPFKYFNFEIGFLENESPFKKLEYHFLVESNKIKIASLPHNTAISDANVKTNRMVTAKSEVLPVITLFF